jgi:broad specificity phosphatase PhoE
MLRHRQTADGAVGAAGWDAQIAEDADWDEFDHMSTLSGAVEWSEIEGETYDERVRRFEATIDRWSSGEHDDEYRESFPAFQQRVRGAFERTVERLEPKQTAVVFTSGGPVSWVAATLAEGGLPAWSRLSKVVVNSSVTKVLTGRRGTNLLTFNDHSHLEGGAPGLLTYR